MNIFNPLFWFSIQAANVGGLAGKIILGFFLFLIAIGIVCRIILLSSSKERYMKLFIIRVMHCALTMGFLGVLVYFFSYEGIQLFGARFWYPLWVLGCIVWVIVLVKFVMKDVPAMHEKNMKQHTKSKYLLGRKK